MDKLFLLGLSVLYFSRDGKSEFGFFKEYDVVEGIVCHVCKRFVDNRCLESEDSCLMQQPSKCEAKIFFSLTHNVWFHYPLWQPQYSILNCNAGCKESERIANGKMVRVLCCNRDYCNKPRNGRLY